MIQWGIERTRVFSYWGCGQVFILVESWEAMQVLKVVVIQGWLASYESAIISDWKWPWSNFLLIKSKIKAFFAYLVGVAGGQRWAMAANEADYTSVVLLTVGLEERWWRCEGGGALPTQEMRWALMWAVWQKNYEGLVSILTMWKLCDSYGIVPTASWHFLRICVLEAQGGAIVGVAPFQHN